ncbi:PHP domain-containing protein [bacterium]|nr:PHP domain-containing protein [bacterium]
MKNSYIDLHSHSTASDGELRPAELVKLAVELGLAGLALTDHDTAEGNGEAVSAAAELGLDFVPGVEISLDNPPNSLHLLGYYIDYNNPALKNTLAEVVGFRDKRNPMIIDKMRNLGIDITYDEVCDIAGGDVVGRPHFAKVLIQKGIVESSQEAFDRYLAKDALAHVDKKRLTPEVGINLVLKAGGIPVLAHPYYYKFGEPDGLDRLIRELVSHGLAGVEAFYSVHSRAQTEEYIRLAEKYDLLITGGSDFHGSTKPDIELGRGISGNLRIPYSVLENLKIKHCALKSVL